MTGYQEIVTDPSFAEQLVCFTAPMVGNYGVAAEPVGVGRRAREGGADARGARPGVDGLARRARHRRPQRDRHALARAPPARGRRDARGRRRRRRSPRTRRSRRSARQPAMAGAALVAARLAPRAVRLLRRRAGVRVAVVDYGCKRSILRRLAGAGARVTVYPHDVDADELAGYDGVLLSNGPGDPEPLRDEVRDGRATCSGACRCSASASATSCSASRPATRRSSCRSATAARTTRCSSRRTRPRARHEPEPRLRGRALERRGEATHVSLYDGTVEGFDFPELRARSVQFHPEAGPGPHDAWPILERWVEEVAPCRVGMTSTRSA